MRFLGVLLSVTPGGVHAVIQAVRGSVLCPSEQDRPDRAWSQPRVLALFQPECTPIDSVDKTLPGRPDFSVVVSAGDDLVEEAEGAPPKFLGGSRPVERIIGPLTLGIKGQLGFFSPA